MKLNTILNLPASANLAIANVHLSASFPQSCPFTKWEPTKCLDDNLDVESTANIKSAQ
jgi:hypothetical protein